MGAESEHVKITAGRLLLWLLAVVIWIICLPAYLAIWAWRWLTGRPVKAAIWMFTGK